MVRRFVAVLALLALAVPLVAQTSINPGRGPNSLSRALADSLYCALAGCTMTGKLRLINGTAAAPSADSAAGAGFHLTATALGIDVGGNTSTICGQGCATVSGGTYGWSSSATDATAAADTVLSRAAAGFVGATSGYRAGDGGVNTASFGFTAEPTLGLFRFGAGQLGITSAGTVGWFSSTGYHGFGTVVEAFNDSSSSADGLVIDTNGSATVGVQKLSPRLRLTGSGWKTDATAGAQTVDWIVENQPVQGTASPSSNLVFSSQVNAGGYTQRATLSSAGLLTLPGTLQVTGNVGIDTAPSVTSGIFLQATSALDAQTRFNLTNTNGSGTSANAGFAVTADVASLVFASHGSGRLVSRWGAAVGGWSELLSSSGNGLAIGTSNVAPLKLGANSITGMSFDGTTALPSLPLAALTAGTMTLSGASAELRGGWYTFAWTNAMVTAIGGVGAGDITVCTLPAKTKVTDAMIVIDTPDTSANALTIALGTVSATYIDWVVASDAKAAANTVYGDATAERGTNMVIVGGHMPSYTATTAVKVHLIKTSTNLSTVLGSTGHILIKAEILP